MHNSVVEGIDALAVTMLKNPDKLVMPDRIKDLTVTKIKLGESLFSLAKQTGHKHAGWIDLAGGSYGDIYDNLFWYDTFVTLSERFDVPMSWVACIDIYPVVGSLGGQWTVLHESEGKVPKMFKNFNIFDKEGNCREMIYAAHLDGVERGLISNVHFPFDRPDVVKEWTNEANNHLETMAEVLDKSVEEVLDSLKKPTEHELYTPYEDDDDSLNK